MIFSNIESGEPIEKKYTELVVRAIRYLQEHRHEFQTMETGIYPIEGDDFFVQVFDVTTRLKEEAKPEVHRKYVELHYSVEGKERIGFAVDLGRNTVTETLLETKDAIYYAQVDRETELALEPGDYAIFFPEDVHRPIWEHGGKTSIRRVVIKINAAIM
ncbi:YhcH/YjgK/YiaL family protein [Paenibacillus forsythiae]|uniref:YhcH/YjgK/YiaL family protein n=1 Tax=Paenibacillus forsythiae TaxID=365616 RepID=A0ABU3H4V3_9BACL|nr:YhcH/YjgK/YiaL family protein [Paenibacillus forsythiae]MDT3425765.1 YhcH/YjgK/YiaL family protein [Paenibacillus forsythiae]